jgi:hypothetical protein
MKHHSIYWIGYTCNGYVDTDGPFEDREIADKRIKSLDCNLQFPTLYELQTRNKAEANNIIRKLY